MSTPDETHIGWSPVQWIGAVLAWIWVSVPLAYGIYELIVKIPALFG